MKQLILIPVLLLAGCLTSCAGKKEERPEHLDFTEFTTQEKLCDMPGSLYVEFEAFMKSKGIKTYAQGDNTYSVTVQRSLKKKALSIVREKEIQSKYYIIEVFEPRNSEQVSGDQ